MGFCPRAIQCMLVYPIPLPRSDLIYKEFLHVNYKDSVMRGNKAYTYFGPFSIVYAHFFLC